MTGFSQCQLHPQKADVDALNWIFVIDTLNFCFWTAGGNNKWEVTWQGKTYTGYFALCAAINRAIDEGYSITNPTTYGRISIKDLKYILRGDNESYSCPLIKERLDCLHQVGLVLQEQFDGKFLNVIKACENSAVKLLNIVVDNFKCYKDEAVYNGKKIAIYKRAQILIGDIWACFKGKEYGYFKDIEELTMFADYRVPQVLIHFGAMEYTDNLMERLKKGEKNGFKSLKAELFELKFNVFMFADEILKNGSEEEVEIRGCSIHAVELVVQEVKRQLPEVKSSPSKDDENAVVCNSILIDHFLWDYRRQHAEELEHIPFHKTLSIYY